MKERFPLMEIALLLTLMNLILDRFPQHFHVASPLRTYLQTFSESHLKRQYHPAPTISQIGFLKMPIAPR